MKYEDGETVVLYKPGHQWHLMNFKAYRSQYTLGAYRLKYGDREILVDESEIRSVGDHNQLLLDDSTFQLFKPNSPFLKIDIDRADFSELEHLGSLLGSPRFHYAKNGASVAESNDEYRERLRFKIRELWK